MAFDGTDSCWIADVPVPIASDWRLRIAQFGDGYAQRTLDGINALNKTWSVTFAMRKREVILAMTAYLEAQKAKSFVYLDQQAGVTVSVFCDAWRVEWLVRRPHSYPIHYGTLTAEFVKANGVTT